MIEVIDNFLDLKSHQVIVDTVLSNQKFPWELSDVIGRKAIKDGTFSLMCDPTLNFQFIHRLSRNIYFDNFGDSEYLYLIVPFYSRLEIKSIFTAKLNYVPVWNEVIHHGMHQDNPFDNTTTAIYYINTNNGTTLFEDGTEVSSVANRLVKFPSKIRHSGSTCTDKSGRVVLNINYF